MRLFALAVLIGALVSCGSPARTPPRASAPTVAEVSVTRDPIGTWSGGTTYPNAVVHATWQLLPNGVAENVVTSGQQVHDTSWTLRGDQLTITATAADGSHLELTGELNGDHWTGHGSVSNGSTVLNTGELRYGRVTE